MKKFGIGILIVLGVILGLVAGNLWYNVGPKVEVEPMCMIAADNLYDECASNVYAAENKYLGERIIVSGYITHISKYFGAPRVRMELADSARKYIQFDLSKIEIRKLRKSELVMIVGTVKYIDMFSNIHLKNCKVL